jgi:hypothetical protein
MEGELVSTGGGRCPVCGQAVSLSLWTCSRCRTPHHKDCAEYFGGCAIFGCRDAHPPDRMERDSWPAVLKHLEQLTQYRRTQAVTAFWFGTSFVSLFAAFLVGAILESFLGREWAGTVMMFMGIYSALGLVAAGPAWLFTELLGVIPVTRRLEKELGEERAARLHISSTTVARSVPRLRAVSILTTYQWIGYVPMVGSILLGIFSGNLVGFAVSVVFVGLLPMVSLALLSTYLDENALYVRRIQASFAPLPGKVSGRMQIGELKEKK